MQEHRYRQVCWRVGGIAWVFAVAALMSGCRRPAESAFVSSEDVLALPETHQQQIRNTLTRLFGTPATPRFAIGSEEQRGAGSEPPLEDLVAPDRLMHGARWFDARCARCHGVAGDGNGVEAPKLRPRPRDYRRGVFKYTSTPYGAKPLRQDLIRTVREGIAGAGMPASADLSADDLETVVEYVIVLSYRGEVERDVALAAALDYGEQEAIEWATFLDSLERIHQSWLQAGQQVVMPVTPEPANSAESIATGQKAFISRGCWKCHGEDGRGQAEWLSEQFQAQQQVLPEAERIKLNYDAWGHLAPAADLRGARLHGGSRPIDIYRRLYCGINGTPMPPFALTFAEKPEEIWHVVHYLQSLVAQSPVGG